MRQDKIRGGSRAPCRGGTPASFEIVELFFAFAPKSFLKCLTLGRRGYSQNSKVFLIDDSCNRQSELRWTKYDLNENYFEGNHIDFIAKIINTGEMNVI